MIRFILKLLFLFSLLMPFSVFAETITWGSTAVDSDGYGISGEHKVAEKFTLSASATNAVFHIKLKGVSTPDGDTSFQIFSDSGGLPNVALYTGSVVHNSALTSSCVSQDSTFTGMSLSSGVQYWVVLDDNHTTGHAEVCTDDAEHLFYTDNGGTWHELGFNYGLFTGSADFSTSGGSFPVHASSSLILMQQGIRSVTVATTTSGVAYTLRMGRGYVGTSSVVLMQYDFHKVSSYDFGVADFVLTGYNDSAYSDASTTCEWNNQYNSGANPDFLNGQDSWDSVTQFYIQLEPINKSFSDCLMDRYLYYGVVITFTQNPADVDNLVVHGVASSSLLYSVNHPDATYPKFVPMFALTGDGFRVYDSTDFTIAGLGGRLATECVKGVGQCALALVTPQPDDWSLVYDNYIVPIFQLAPWGYVTRGVSLFNGTAESTPDDLVLSTDLPSLNVDVKQTGLPITAGVSSVDLTPWYHLMGSSSILGTATDYQGNTFRDVTETYWDFLVAFMFGVGAIGMILGLDVVGGARNAVIRSRRK